MKKAFICFLLLSLFLISGCKKEDDTYVLRIYNWEDYIDEDIPEKWKEDWESRNDGKEVKVIYNTFETNEYMLNVLKTGSEHYDLVCPSDYFIQKMIAEDMLEEFTGEIENYERYGSPYIKQIFKENKTESSGKAVSWNRFTIPYMWGTMGFVYNMDEVEESDVKTWEILWNSDYKKKSTVKNSIHDTYVAGVMHVHREELMKLKDRYEKKEIDWKEYNAGINELMNDYTPETLMKTEEALTEMKENIYGFEVDSGKTDILDGRITINFAWSGDAVYSMNEADEAGKTKLGYAVPCEGSNVWFDGWVMPKGANTDLAEDFLNFICNPEWAARNMDEIGYTSSIAGDAIWNLIRDWYEVEDETAEVYEVDLSYFFGNTVDSEYLSDGKAIIKVSERGRQFDAQYPEEEVLRRCGVMRDFGDRNEDMLRMWERVKCGEIEIWLWIGRIVLIPGIVFIIVYKLRLDKKYRKRKLKK